MKYVWPVFQAALIFAAVRILSGDVLQYAAGSSLGGEWGIRNLIFQLFPYDLLNTALAAAILLAVFRAPRPALRGWEYVYAAAVALLWLLGYAFNATKGWGILFGRKINILLSAVTYTGLLFFTATALRWVKGAARALAAWEPKFPKPLRNHPFLISWAVIFLCWLPFALIRYPAGIEYDAYYQMEQFLGFRPMTAHWPPFSSMLMGSFVWLGKAVFGSWDVGVFLFVLFQAAVCSAVLAYTIPALEELGVSRGWQAVCLAVYSLATIFSGYLTSVLKDALFSAVTVLLITLLALCLHTRPRPGRLLALGASGLLLCLLRSNGAYVLIPCALILAVAAIVRRGRGLGRLALALIVPCLLNVGYQKLLLPALDIPAGSVAEALSVPFQQTARYLRDHPDDVTEEERAVIGGVLDVEALPELYDPDLSDPVKSTYHGDTQGLIRYFGVWFKQFFRHPGDYFQATLANACGYYYPNARNLVFYTGTWNMDQLIFHEPEALKGLKGLLNDYVALFESAPGLMLLGSAGFHTWVTLYFVLAALAGRDKKRLFLLLPSVLGTLICLCGPTYTVNGARYALPVIYATPLLTGICAFTKDSGTGKAMRGRDNP